VFYDIPLVIAEEVFWVKGHSMVS